MPTFMLSGPTARELEIYEYLWELPQASVWAESRMEMEVAIYCRLVARAESPKSSAIIWGQVKMAAESLGLSTAGMLRNRWRVGTQEVTDVPAAPRRITAKDRLRAVDG